MRGAAMVLLAGLIVASGADAGEGLSVAKLRFNPFVKPSLPAAEPNAKPEFDRASAWRPELTATLVSGENSIANLGGAVLRLGEEANGYKLVAVRHYEADFERNGEVMTLSLDANHAGDR